MNLLLLEPGEVQATGEARLSGRRAQHLREVLRVTVDTTVRCGVVDGPLGTARVVATDGDDVVLACSLDEPSPRPEHMLLLAVPRPKVLRRVIRDAVCLGYGHIVLFRSWKVDRSHLESHDMAADALDRCVRDGLEQAKRTWRPVLTVEPLFKPFVEDRLDEMTTDFQCCVAHPGRGSAATRIEQPVALAIGPERGFTDYEVVAFEAHGFAPVHLGTHPLRVEAAVAGLSGALLPLA